MVPQDTLRSPKNRAASKGSLGPPPAARVQQRTQLRLGGALEGPGARQPLTFSPRGDRTLSQAHTHLRPPPRRLPAHTCTAPLCKPSAHGGSHVLSRTQFHTHVHTHTRAHTQGRGKRQWGPRQGDFSAVVAQKSGRRLDPSLGRDPVRKMAEGGVLGTLPHPQGAGLPGHL